MPWAGDVETPVLHHRSPDPQNTTVVVVYSIHWYSDGFTVAMFFVPQWFNVFPSGTLWHIVAIFERAVGRRRHICV